MSFNFPEKPEYVNHTENGDKPIIYEFRDETRIL